MSVREQVKKYRLKLLLGGAKAAGTLVRLAGLVGAAAVSVALGELAGHIWHRGVTVWVALLAGGLFAILAAVEMNRRPRPPVYGDAYGEPGDS